MSKLLLSLLAQRIGRMFGCKRQTHPFPFWSIRHWLLTVLMGWTILPCVPGARAICSTTPKQSSKGEKRWAIVAIRISWAGILWWGQTAVFGLPTPAAILSIGRLSTSCCMPSGPANRLFGETLIQRHKLVGPGRLVQGQNGFNVVARFFQGEVGRTAVKNRCL